MNDEVTLSAAYRAVAVTFKTLVHSDKVTRTLFRDAEQISTSDVNVLLLGETGTGKNLIAQAIHNASKRAAGPFVSLNCSSIPDSLLEAELFGAEEGAYTDARKSRKGRFELADGGTLFLDEIADLSPDAQAKILHAIEYKQFTRVGGESLLSSDTRIIAATNRPLEQYVEDGHFRNDLFYRLQEFVLRVPPLRERLEDIPPLVELFIEECNERYEKSVKKLDKRALNLLKQHQWPGNIRELRGVIKRGMACVSSNRLGVNELQLKVRSIETSLEPDSDLSLAAAEKRHIEAVLQMTDWIKSEAARVLGISRPTLDRKIEAYSLRKSD